MKKITVLVLVAASAIMFSCKSQEVQVAPEASALEIVQQAQTAFDKGNKDQAIKYYEILLQRYGNNPATYVEARYEIAHIYVKQKKYKDAEPILTELKQIYDASTPGVLPGAYRKMALKDLDKVNEKLGQKK
ncbi:MAG: tetratricopeptide repeat protein [Treponema sp.]|nr:tetratricopeptide repeat protein [Candidatus Treponema equi]